MVLLIERRGVGHKSDDRKLPSMLMIMMFLPPLLEFYLFLLFTSYSFTDKNPMIMIIVLFLLSFSCDLMIAHRIASH